MEAMQTWSVGNALKVFLKLGVDDFLLSTLYPSMSNFQLQWNDSQKAIKQGQVYMSSLVSSESQIISSSLKSNWLIS